MKDRTQYAFKAPLTVNALLVISILVVFRSPSSAAENSTSEKKSALESKTISTAGQGEDKEKEDTKTERKEDKAEEGPEKETLADEISPCRGADAAELKILTALRERHEALDERERHLETREALFAQQKIKLMAKIDALSATLSELERKLELGAPAQKAKEEKLMALVQAIDSLSAKKAAPMLSEADPTLAGEILRRVGPARSAALLAVMATAKAARLINEVGGDSIPKSQIKIPSSKPGAKP